VLLRSGARPAPGSTAIIDQEISTKQKKAFCFVQANCPFEPSQLVKLSVRTTRKSTGHIRTDNLTACFTWKLQSNQTVPVCALPTIKKDRSGSNLPLPADLLPLPCLAGAGKCLMIFTVIFSSCRPHRENLDHVLLESFTGPRLRTLEVEQCPELLEPANNSQVDHFALLDAQLESQGVDIISCRHRDKAFNTPYFSIVFYHLPPRFLLQNFERVACYTQKLNNYHGGKHQAYRHDQMERIRHDDTLHILKNRTAQVDTLT